MLLYDLIFSGQEGTDELFCISLFRVACGMGHSMVIVDRENIGDRLDQVNL